MAKTATVFTHRRAGDTADAVRQLIAAARLANYTLKFDSAETAKHGLEAADGVVIDAEFDREVDLCVVLGGDGTILYALRKYAETKVPVFAVKYGDVGFLATVDPDGLANDFARAFAGEFERLQLPGVVGELEGGKRYTAFNEISLHRKYGLRVAELAYSLSGVELGHVRCDGIVVSTPAGSTGYNLANGGPVLAWGVEGFIVSFIAPHSLTARPLVAAPGDRLTVLNVSVEGAVQVFADGQPVSAELQVGKELRVDFGSARGTLALLPGTTFYHRLRDRFGRLAR